MNPAPPPLSRYEVLRELHSVLAPEVYFEVGVQLGPSLALAEKAGRAYGVDPHPIIQPENIRPNQRVSAQTSDAFWSCESCERPIIDFAFIDGSHLFEDALRDFVNIQEHSHAGTVVAFDDVLPYNQDVAWRHQPPGDWTGDVFKIPFILREYQPKLDLILVDAVPTGLLLVTGLDPRSGHLRGKYDEIVERYHHGSYRIPADPVTGATTRHWNYVPAEVLARTGATDGAGAVRRIEQMVKAGELPRSSGVRA